jgi:membrane protein YdbS with pleckstrin-like domain
VRAIHEHEFEAAQGLPESLPAGEGLLWQGSPDWRALARDVLHVRKLALYFVAMLLWRVASASSDGATLGSALFGSAAMAGLALVALGTLTLLAWLMSRTSMYTITDKRVVMRVGIVLTVTFNIPFTRIQGAGLRARGAGIGDIVLSLAGTDQIAYVHLWPHARPWHVKRTEPMLRALPNARHVAQLLAQALALSAGQSRPILPEASNDAQADAPATHGTHGPALAA